MKLFEAKTGVKIGTVANGTKFKFVNQKNNQVYVRTGSESYNVVYYKEDGNIDAPANSTHFDTKVFKV